MTSDTENGGSVRYVKFTGKGMDFLERKVKTLSLAKRKGFSEYLEQKFSDHTEDSYNKRNADTWDHLVLSLTGSTITLIMEADGDACVEWNILLNKFDVSEQKQESLTNVTIEWAACRLTSTKWILITGFLSCTILIRN